MTTKEKIAALENVAPLESLQSSIDGLVPVVEALVAERDCLREENERLRAAAKAIAEEFDNRYDGCPDSETLWMGEHIERLNFALQ